MGQYRKKPVVIEAMQINWLTWGQVCKFIDEEYFAGGVYLDDETLEEVDSVTNTIGIKIKTLEGIMLGRQNDWIIKGVGGEFYPCKPDIFEMTYEPVDNKKSPTCACESRNIQCYCSIK